MRFIKKIHRVWNRKGWIQWGLWVELNHSPIWQLVFFKQYRAWFLGYYLRDKRNHPIPIGVAWGPGWAKFTIQSQSQYKPNDFVPHF